MMLLLSNSLQWPNKIGAQRKAAHPSPMGRLGTRTRHSAFRLRSRSGSAAGKSAKVRGAWTRTRTRVRVTVTNRIYILPCLVFMCIV